MLNLHAPHVPRERFIDGTVAPVGDGPTGHVPMLLVFVDREYLLDDGCHRGQPLERRRLDALMLGHDLGAKPWVTGSLLRVETLAGSLTSRHHDVDGFKPLGLAIATAPILRSWYVVTTDLHGAHRLLALATFDDGTAGLKRDAPLERLGDNVTPQEAAALERDGFPSVGRRDERL